MPTLSHEARGRKVTVKAWVGLSKRGTILPCDDGYGTLLVADRRNSKSDVAAGYVTEVDRVVRCTITYYAAKPTSARRRGKR